MTEWKIILKSLVCGINCCLHSETTELVDDKSQKRYSVEFKSLGVCIQDFDKVSFGAFGTRKCFDVLSASETAIQCIELKSAIHGKDLKKLGDKFYFGHIKAQTIIAPLAIKYCSYKYIVIYTKDVFSENKPEDELQKRANNLNNKDSIHAWNNNKVLLEKENIIIDPFRTGEIPIKKYLYTNQPIQFD